MYAKPRARIGLILTAGEIVAHGNPEEIATNEKVKCVYLGDNFTLN